MAMIKHQERYLTRHHSRHSIVMPTSSIRNRTIHTFVKDKENFQNHAFIQSLTHNEEQMSGTRTKNAEGRRNDAFEL